MKNMKYNIIFGIALVCVMLFTTCDNNPDSPESNMQIESGFGKIRISFAGEEAVPQMARTVMPSTTFYQYTYTFTKAGEETGVVKAPDNNGFFTLEVGSYMVEVQAYTGDAESYTLTATGVSSEFNVGSGSNDPVEVILTGIDTGTHGEFSYTITYPAGAMAEITLQKWLELDDITLNPGNITQGNGKTQTLQLETGSYLFTVLVSKAGLYAGISEAVHIYPSLSTVYTKNYVDSDMIPKVPGAAVSAPTLNSATQNSVMINSVDPPSNGQAVEYGINTSNTIPSTWQTGLTFSGLSGGVYYIFARSTENDDYTAGVASASLQVIIVTTTTQWSTALTTIGNGGSGTTENAKTYIIMIFGNVTVSGTTSTGFNSVQYIEVTLKGSGTLSLSSSGSILRLGSNQKLIIDDENLTLQGRSGNNNAVMYVSTGGTLELKNGAINGNTSSANGGGVYISGGNFTMSGGTISGNTATGSSNSGGGVYVYSGSFTMSGGIISGNTAGYRGGGVYVVSPGSFTISGGIVYGSSAGSPLANTASGTINGAALYLVSGTAKYGDDTNILPHTDNQSLYTNNTIIPGIAGGSPVTDNYNISGIGTFTYDGSAKTVTITPKENIPSGEITVLYNGSTTAPVNAGTFTVTFNVAAVSGFDGITGLRAGTITINRAAGAAVSAPSGTSSVTDLSITINAVTAPANGQTVEYARNTTTTVPTSGWQDGTTLTGLTGSTSYYIFARAKENTNYNAGTAQRSASTITTFHTYTVAANGSQSSRESTTSLTFTFTANPGTISANNITLSGNASKGSATVTGSGNTRTLSPITVTASGSATVSISLSGVETGSKTVNVLYYPALTGTVTITGTPALGVSLGVNTASLGGSGTISYQWKRGTTNISGATSSTYTVQSADEGNTISVTVTRANNSGSITSATVGPVPKTWDWNTSTPPVGMNNGDIIIIGVGASGTLVIPSGATVTIGSSGTGWVSNGSRSITLNISANARIIWRATYESSSSPAVSITETSAGTFEVAEGWIHSSSYQAINTSSNCTILVSGGNVSSWSYYYASGATINSTGASGTVTVSGGQVIAYGDNSYQAINVAGTLNVTGGLVIAELPNATGSRGSGVVSKTPNSITGGTIIGYTLGGSHTANSTTGLSFLPASGANVSWGLRDTWETGINYRGNFYPISGVSVGNRIVWNSDRVPSSSSIVSGSTITIAAGANGTLTVPASVTTTIVSQGTEAVDNGNRTITLSIGASAKVTWRANYTASFNSWTNNNFITISGTGTFDIAGGNIYGNPYNDNATIYSSSNSSIIVSGGVVQGWPAISSTGSGTVTVSGGRVSTTTGTAISSTGTSGTVAVSGGVVSATTGQAINSNANGILNITGGLVIAQRNAVLGTNGVISRNNWNALSGNGTIIGYTAGTYNAGTTTGLVFEPTSAAVSWGASNGQSALNYPSNGVYTPVPNVSVIGTGGATAIFNEDFEGTNSFTIVNGSQTNKWYVGTATSYAGTKSCYISDNSGTSNAYTLTSSSVVHIYRNVTFTSSSTPYTLSFYWKAQGESTYDYMTVWLVETSTTPVAGTQLATGSIGSTRYNLGGTGWNSATISIPASNSGTTKRLVFTWVNDSSAGTTPPVAIDNVVLTK